MVEKTTLSAINKLTVGALLFAIAPLPYSYYIILRWGVFVSTSIHLYCAFNRRRLSSMVIFVVIGVLFNPIEPVYLTKGLWVIIDILCAMFMSIGFEELDKKADSANIPK